VHFKCDAATHQESPGPRPRELSEHAAVCAHVGGGGAAAACSHGSDTYSRSPWHRRGRKLRPEVFEKQGAMVEVDGQEHQHEDAIAESIRKTYVVDEVSRATQAPFTDKGLDGQQ
jgi:hypothetical protein